MEDPWGDPWSTDVPAPTIELPAAVYAAKSAADGLSPRPVTDPWSTEADGWTGWGGRSPDLRAGPSSPDPWAGVERKLLVEEKSDENQIDERVWEPEEADGDPVRRHVPDTGRQSSKVAELVDMYDGMARHSGRSSSTKRPVARDDVVVSGTDDAPPPLPDLGEEKTLVEAGFGIQDEESTLRNGEDEESTLRNGEDEESTSRNGKECERDDGFSEVETDHVADQTRDETVSKSPTEDWQVRTDATVEVEEATAPALDESISKPSPGECRQDDDTLTVEVNDDTAKTSPTTSHNSQRNECPYKVVYPIELAGLLDSIFPSVSSPPSCPEPTSMSPVKDTFSNVSERKAWYRISRPGSMRRHVLGDEDGYTRVGWAKSRTREHTLKIVRRWMEEDSIGSRNVLGRRLGSGRSTLFNWDSPASTAVPIGELFRREKGMEGGSDPTVAVAAFDWSSSRGAADAAGAKAEAGGAVVSRPAEAGVAGVPLQPLKGPQLSQAAEQRFSLKPHPSSAQGMQGRQTASPAPAAVDDDDDVHEEDGGDGDGDGDGDDGDDDNDEGGGDGDEDEDEDDWGEMVSASADSAPASSRKAAWSSFGDGDEVEDSPVRGATSRLLPGTPAARSAASRRRLMSGESPVGRRGGREDDEVVGRIVGAIPDLSYMLG
ncbi:hypothetical protein CP533_4047 [Ophiocordyceps camponoti-saundersi (nom. inval.)]|nr:hypothetical protein CP533_4047 [Ophiocordyceps camponoti-saundersi (nom. inval.)]